jgi:hypothetical protein
MSKKISSKQAEQTRRAAVNAAETTYWATRAQITAEYNAAVAADPSDAGNETASNNWIAAEEQAATVRRQAYRQAEKVKYLALGWPWSETWEYTTAD